MKQNRKLEIGDEVIAYIPGTLETIKGVVRADDHSELCPYFVDLEDGHGSWFNEHELQIA